MAESGYPGKKAIGIGGGVTREGALQAARNMLRDHEKHNDPHKQYKVSFATHWKWQ